MLGTRTKQVFSYGRRNQRIVSVADDPARTAPGILDSTSAVPWAPVASRMKKRENKKSESPSPRIVRVKRKTIDATSPSPRIQIKRKVAVSPKAKKSTRVRQILADGPTRPVLAAYSLNAPNSPALSAQRPKQSPNATPGLRKQFSPFVDMDIIVLDDDGNTVSRERRVSRTDTYVDDDLPLSQPKPRRRVKRLIISDESDVEDAPEVHAIPKRLEVEAVLPPLRKLSIKPTKRTKPILVDSDSPESELDTAPVLLPITIPKPDVPQIQVNIGCRERPIVLSDELEDEDTLPTVLVNAPRILSPPRHLLQPSRYQTLPSPVARPRQLTPIRGRRQLYNPPSPTTPTDLDYSLDLSNISPSSGPPSPTRPPAPAYLRPLLNECKQESCGAHEFSAFIDSFPYDPLVASRGAQFRKIGEASYSEVFGIGDVVLKIIPLRDENAHVTDGDGEGPAPSDARDVLKEIIVTRAMGELCEGFVTLLRTYVVRGRYPEVLLSLWDEYLERKGSESVRPDTFGVAQLYAIIVLPNGGPDLEAYNFSGPARTGWKQACSLFWQVAKALAHAEALVSFEHRDLHWGQILVKNIPITILSSPVVRSKTGQENAVRSVPKKAAQRVNRVLMDDLGHGVYATLIDLGLSRMDAGDGSGGERVHWTPFDEEVFMGEGDYQFDIYRMMREYNGGKWEQFRPMSNVMWLHYLALKLLNGKRLKAPAASRTPVPNAGAFSERECYECLVSIEALLSAAVVAAMPSKVKARARAKRIATCTWSCAGEVVGYAVREGWIQAVPGKDLGGSNS